MKERGKAVEAYRNSNYTDYNYSASSDLPCKKHPSSSTVGICAHCLKDRLIQLVCSDCGEQRMSSCCCSEEPSSHRNSCTVEVGIVGRMSFLIENEKTEPQQHTHPKPKAGERTKQEVIKLKRCSSSCVEAKRSNEFWKLSRLFRKKKVKGSGVGGDSDGFDDKSETWMSEYMGVSRSRSLCSFRVGGLNDLDEGSEFAFSSAKISDVTGSLGLESDKQCGGNEAETRKSRFSSVLDLDSATNVVANRIVFPINESEFSGMDESEFIDLKINLSSDSKTEFSDLKMSGVSGLGGCRDSLGDGCPLSHGGSFRITVNDIGIKRGPKGHKVWKWIFRHQPNWRSGSKNDENQLFKP